jgi:hypothetical protein
MNLSQAIKETAMRGERVYLTLCTVDKVDETARTIDCTTVDEVELLSVQLQAGLEGTAGLVVFPEVGSEVVVGYLDRNNAVVLLYSEIGKIHLAADKIVINGESLGGLVNIGILTDKINALVKAFNNHTHTIPGGATISGSTPAGAFTGTITSPVTVPEVSSGAAELNRSEYEDDKVMHG